jgi:hypothetical protein
MVNWVDFLYIKVEKLGLSIIAYFGHTKNHDGMNIPMKAA